MRAAVGDRKLSFVGYSYGTYLATVYANLYPHRVRAIVADGAINPRAWRGAGPSARRIPIDVRLKSDTGTSAALHSFLNACDDNAAACAFAPTGAEGSSAKFDRLMRLLRRHPVAISNSRTATYTGVVSTVRWDLYDTERWIGLGHYLQRVWNHRHATARARVSGQPLPARPPVARAAGYDNYLDIAEAVTCSDSHNPTRPAAWERWGRKRDLVAPYFGRWWTWLDEACATWSLPSPGRYDGRFDQVTAHPVLVVGTRRDPATRYGDAVALAKILPRSRLLTVDGTGHTSRGVHSACVTHLTSAYLLRGELPRPGAVCRPDDPPFSPAS